MKIPNVESDPYVTGVQNIPLNLEELTSTTVARIEASHESHGSNS